MGNPRPGFWILRFHGHTDENANTLGSPTGVTKVGPDRIAALGACGSDKTIRITDDEPNPATIHVLSGPWTRWETVRAT